MTKSVVGAAMFSLFVCVLPRSDGQLPLALLAPSWNVVGVGPPRHDESQPQGNGAGDSPSPEVEDVEESQVILEESQGL